MARIQEVDREESLPDSRQEVRELTHVNSIVELIVNNLKETDDMTVTTFFHDGDFLAYLLFEAAKLVS